MLRYDTCRYYAPHQPIRCDATFAAPTHMSSRAAWRETGIGNTTTTTTTATTATTTTATTTSTTTAATATTTTTATTTC